MSFPAFYDFANFYHALLVEEQLITEIPIFRKLRGPLKVVTASSSDLGNWLGGCFCSFSSCFFKIRKLTENRTFLINTWYCSYIVNFLFVMHCWCNYYLRSLISIQELSESWALRQNVRRSSFTLSNSDLVVILRQSFGFLTSLVLFLQIGETNCWPSMNFFLLFGLNAVSHCNNFFSGGSLANILWSFTVLSVCRTAFL